MEKNVYNVNEACILLKNGVIMVDFHNARFKFINENIIIKNDNARYVLCIEEFLNLYKDSKFIILEEGDAIIDIKKDEEYYSFKHKWLV